MDVELDTPNVLGVASQFRADAQPLFRVNTLPQDGANLGLSAAAMLRRPKPQGAMHCIR